MASSEQFASVPEAVPTRQKYRDENPSGLRQNNNIMNDRRVIRGNTYASLLAEEDTAGIQKHRAAQSQRLRRANQRKDRPGTPDAPMGRKHMDIQTDTYLEELTDRTVAFEAETMTDFLLDRPPSPLFMPSKVGADVDTQIEEGDLFDFDLEAEVVLEVLVGKTLELSMSEVLEEEEIAAMRRHQEEYERIRAVELLEVNRIEAQEQRRADECERRKTQAKNQEELRKLIRKKICSRGLAMEYLSSLKRRVVVSLADSGTIASHEEAPEDIESQFLPWLLNEVNSRMEVRKRNRDLFEDLATQAAHACTKQRRRVLQAARASQFEVDQAERRIQWEDDERNRLEKLEAERIQAELEEKERLDAIVDIEVLEYGEEGVKLADEEIELAELSEEIKAELAAKWPEKTDDNKVVLTVNKMVNEAIAVKLVLPDEDAEVEAAS